MAVVRFSSKTYGMSTNYALSGDNVTWLGEGMHQTTIKALAGLTTQLITNPSASLKGLNFKVEDMCFDGSDLTTQIMVASGNYFKNLTFNRCRFTGLASGRAFNLSNMNRMRLNECVFDAPGTGVGTAVNGFDGVTDLEVKACRFMYLGKGMYLQSSSSNEFEDLIEDVRFIDNYCDGGWFLLKALSSGSGGTVTYSSTVLTDTAASFSGLTTDPSFKGQTVRIMPVRESGSLSAMSNVTVSDGAKNFTSAGVKRGDIIRATDGVSNIWAVVSGLESATVLRVEDWRDQTTYRTVKPPLSTGWTYTIYGLIFGEARSHTGTTITVGNWQDLEGNNVTPSAGTRYEVLTGRPSTASVAPGSLQTCGFWTERMRNGKITGNTFRRSFNDQVGIQGSRGTLVALNSFEDGRDMGFTTDYSVGNISRNNTIVNNRAFHNGVSGFSIAGDDHIVANNFALDNAFSQNTAGRGSNYKVFETHRLRMTNNKSKHENTNMPFRLYGIDLTSNNVDAELIHNEQYGYLTAGVRVLDTSSTGTRISANTGSVLDAGSGTKRVPVAPVSMLASWGASSSFARIINATATDWRASQANWTKADLWGLTQAMLVVRQLSAGVAGAKVFVEYSTDASTWVSLAASGNIEVECQNTGTKDSGWVDIATLSKAFVFLRLRETGGDGATSSNFGTVSLMGR